MRYRTFIYTSNYNVIIYRGMISFYLWNSLTKIYKFSKDNPDLFESDKIKLLEFWWIHILIQMISQIFN